jgi:ribosomal protein L35AE/L33A
LGNIVQVPGMRSGVSQIRYRRQLQPRWFGERTRLFFAEKLTFFAVSKIFQKTVA